MTYKFDFKIGIRSPPSVAKLINAYMTSKKALLCNCVC